jgi:3-oxoacyl-[acyl-carrier protein] reductase
MSENRFPLSRRIDLTDQVALVTGAANGIGRAIALALAREGADVAVVDIAVPDETAAAIVALGRRSAALVADVADLAAVQRVVTEATSRLGPIAILVNNAGIAERVGLADLTEALWDRTLDVNLRGTYLFTQAVLPEMRARQRGSIVNISSISGKIGGAVSRGTSATSGGGGRSGPAYAASKGGIIAFTRWVAKDAGHDGIRANCVCPGPVATNLTRGFDYGVDAQPIPRMGAPDDIAEAVVFLASPAASFITGQALNVDGGLVMD